MPFGQIDILAQQHQGIGIAAGALEQVDIQLQRAAQAVVIVGTAGFGQRRFGQPRGQIRIAMFKLESGTVDQQCGVLGRIVELAVQGFGLLQPVAGLLDVAALTRDRAEH